MCGGLGVCVRWARSVCAVGWESMCGGLGVYVRWARSVCAVG